MESSRQSAAQSDPQTDMTIISTRTPGGARGASAEIGRALQGKSLGPYQLEEFVGGGGMGAVFRALDTTLNRIVAVKVLSSQQSADEEMLKRFKNEAQSAARLDHENIGRVYAVGSEDGWHFIVFEFIEGTNLRDVVTQTGAFDMPRTINVTIQIADALQHACDRDVVHRDIKPSNIIITPAGRARLVDMGLARLHQVGGDEELTVSGMTLGTFDYISPEQARDSRSADVRSDLYSLGCTVFYMLVGRAPFANGTMVQKLLQHQQDPPPAIALLRPDVPHEFAIVLSRLMEKDPANRYQSPRELVVDLVAVAEQQGIDITASRPAMAAGIETVAEGKDSRMPWLVPIIGLAVVVGTLWWLSARPRWNQSSGLESQRTSGIAPRSLDASSVEVQSDRLPWRVVDVPAAAEEVATLGAALQRAVDGDVIELAYDSVHDEAPVVIDGKHITLRAAEGLKPAIRFVPLTGTPSMAVADPRFISPNTVSQEAPFSKNVSERSVAQAGQRQVAACAIVSGSLSIQNIRVVLGIPPGQQDDGPVLFSLSGAASLACENVSLELPSDEEGSAGSDRRSAFAPATCVQVIADGSRDILTPAIEPGTVGSGTDRSGAVRPRTVTRGAARTEMGRCEVRMTQSSMVGDGIFLDASDGGQVDVIWSGGTCITTRRFLLAEGRPRTASGGTQIRLTLSHAIFASRAGFACLLDSPALPLVSQLQVHADTCRFVTPEGSPLLEQSGIEEPDVYRAAIEWVDVSSRYEGSRVFRQIDGSAERVELDFAASPQPLVHTSRIVPPIKGW
ncbi:MAG: serine/threonine-protein kinase [Planctomycetota bacterium]